MMTLPELKQQIEKDPENFAVYLMDFVDDFRYYKDESILNEAFSRNDDRWCALLAAVAESLCQELSIPVQGCPIKFP